MTQKIIYMPVKRKREADGHIYRLVNSLTPFEKRFVNSKLKVLAGKRRKISIWLFNEILKSELGKDEEINTAFCKKFNESSFIANKHYLQNYILESLITIQSDNTYINLLNSIVECRILFNKSLHENCEKLLNKVLKQAYEDEQFLITFDLLKIQRDIIIQRVPNDMRKRLEEISREQARLLDLQHNLMDYNKVYDEFFSLISMYNKNPSDEMHEHINKLIDTPLLDHITRAKSFKAQILFYETKGLYSFFTGDNISASSYYLLCAELMEQNEKFRKNSISRYITILSNYLNSSLKAAKYDKFPEVFQKIHQLKTSNPYEEIKLFQNTASAELFYYVNVNKHVVALGRLEQMEKQFKIYNGKLTKADEIGLMYNFSNVYFSNAKFDKALKWIQKLLQDENSSIRVDIVENARIMHMILIFELKIENQLKSYRRVFKKTTGKRLNDDPEKRIFGYLTEIAREIPGRKRKEKIKQILEKVIRWSNDPDEIKFPGYGELRLWLEAKVRNTTPGDANIQLDIEEGN